MNFLGIVALLLSLSDSTRVNDCTVLIIKMAESTKEYKLKRKEAEHLAKCTHGWQLSGSPNKEDFILNSLTSQSLYYDIQSFCKYEDDEFYFYESFSFNPATNSLYISKNIGYASKGEYQIKLFKRVRYKKKWLRKFLKCKECETFRKGGNVSNL